MPEPRDHWSSRLGFVLAAAGSAVGLGNLWKFPYITWENRGGAFVLIYLACIAAVGLPIMIAEILIGRRTQQSPVGALRQAVGRPWAAVGALGVVTGFVILGYYTVIAGWSLRNFVECLDWSWNGFPIEGSVPEEFGQFLSSWPAQVTVSVLFMAATMGVIYGGVGHGIERASRWLMPLLFSILALLLGTALTMSGASEALGFIFEPRFADLERDGVLEALGHAFFTLSLGMGAMITYGSYMDRRESITRSAILVVLLDTLIALVATVIMFSVIFSEDMQEAVSRSAVGMLFVTLPRLFYTAVPLGSLLAPLFYVLVAFAALTSTISLLEVLVSYFIDERGMKRRTATTVCGLGVLVLSVLCALSLGAHPGLSGVTVFDGKPGLLATLDHLASNWLLPVGGFLITLAAGWFMTRRETESELAEDRAPAWFRYGVWRFFIRWVSPVAVGAIILAVVSGKDFS